MRPATWIIASGFEVAVCGASDCDFAGVAGAGEMDGVGSAGVAALVGCIAKLNKKCMGLDGIYIVLNSIHRSKWTRSSRMYPQ